MRVRLWFVANHLFYRKKRERPLSRMRYTHPAITWDDRSARGHHPHTQPAGRQGPHGPWLLPVEGCCGHGPLRGQGQEPARPHAPVRSRRGRARQDPLHDGGGRELRLRGRGLRARGARARDEPHPAVPPALQRRLQGRQELPLHRHHQGGRLPRAQVHARAAPSGDALLWPLHRRPLRPRGHRHRAQGLPHVRGELRRVASRQAPGRLPPRRRGPHRDDLRQQRSSLLRLPRGAWPGRVRGRGHGRGVRRADRGRRALPLGPSRRVPGRARRADARGRGGARLRACGPHQAAHRRHPRARRHPAGGVPLGRRR